jgi:hypothetical protein
LRQLQPSSFIHSCTKVKSNVVGAPFRQKHASKLFKKRFLTRRSSITEQKQNHCASNRPWQRSFLPNTTTNQQYRGTSLSIKIVAHSLCNFIMVDCCLVASFLNLVKNPRRGPVLGGPLVYVAGTFSKWTGLTQTFLLSRGRSPHSFSSNSCQKSGCLRTYF